MPKICHLLWLPFSIRHEAYSGLHLEEGLVYQLYLQFFQLYSNQEVVQGEFLQHTNIEDETLL